MKDKIITEIKCQNIAPIENLTRVIESNSLKMGVFASNGSGKTFLSRLFRLTENSDELVLDESGVSPTDKLISLRKNSGSFSFSIRDKDGKVEEQLSVTLRRGVLPSVSKTSYLYHTFNQDYVEDNIKALNYEKNGEIEGFILGKVNIDLSEEEDKLTAIKVEGQKLHDKIAEGIKDVVKNDVDGIMNIRRLNEYKLLEANNIIDGEVVNDGYEGKSYTELLSDYNKVKSVPENLADIPKIADVDYDADMFVVIREELSRKYSISELSEEFKHKIKSKQGFIETGLQLLQSNVSSECPFCEQELGASAIELIDEYTKYLSDAEAQAVKQFQRYTQSLGTTITSLEQNGVSFLRIKNLFNEYKSKYIPSAQLVELEEMDIQASIEGIAELVTLVKGKAESIENVIEMPIGIIERLNERRSHLRAVIRSNNEIIEEINVKKRRIDEENRAIRREICRRVHHDLVVRYTHDIHDLRRLRAKWKELNDEIQRKKEQEKVSKRGTVASTIRQVLDYFFSGKYTLDEDTFKLRFYENVLEMNQAKDVLSEGEKNIVAFAYYCGDAHLKINSDSDYARLFFVIDDPISSMDFSHVYTLCGVIRDLGSIIQKLERIRLLVFTHHNEFMRVLVSNNVIDKKLFLGKGMLKEFNNNMTVPYILHLLDIYDVARMAGVPNHTTANSIRHVIETLSKFQNVELSSDSIDRYLKVNLPENKSYILINDLSHGGWRSEQSPINDDDFKEVCETIVKHIEEKYSGQIEYCKKLLEELPNAN